MTKLIFLVLMLSCTSTFAWWDVGCRPITIEGSCIVLCFINANPSLVKVHEGSCKSDKAQKITEEE